jgi:hypothetical protein
VSISAGFFGTLVDHTGVFGEAERFAADAQGADRTMFSVHGSVLAPSVEQVLAGLRRYPEALAVVYTSPTYEGLCANTHAIAAAVHDASEHAMLFVDEAWGGHLHFHPELPPSAVDAGADIAVRSPARHPDHPRGLSRVGGPRAVPARGTPPGRRDRRARHVARHAARPLSHDPGFERRCCGKRCPDSSSHSRGLRRHGEERT